MATFNTTNNELVSFDQDYLWVTKRMPMPTTVKLRLKKDMNVAELLVAMNNILKLDEGMFKMMSDNEIDLREHDSGDS